MSDKDSKPIKKRSSSLKPKNEDRKQEKVETPPQKVATKSLKKSESTDSFPKLAQTKKAPNLKNNPIQQFPLEGGKGKDASEVPSKISKPQVAMPKNISASAPVPNVQQQQTKTVKAPMKNRKKSVTVKLAKGSADSDDEKIDLGTLQRPITNREILKEKPDLLRLQEELIELPLDEKRKKYKVKGPFPTVDQVPTWTQTPSNFYEPLVILNDKSESVSKKGGPLRPKVISVSKPDVEYKADKILNDKISLHFGNIIMLEIDAIVATTDASLDVSSFVQSIITNGGQEVGEELTVVRKNRWSKHLTSKTAITSGYYLPANYVIYVILPSSRSEEALGHCYTSALNLAVRYKLRSIALPCIATGGSGFPAHEACKVALSTVRQWLSQDNNLHKVDRVIFCCVTEQNLELYKRCLPLYYPKPGDQPISDEFTFTDHSFKDETNYIPFSYLDEKQSLLKYCTKLSFKASLFVTDAVFWKLATYLEPGVTYAVKELNCKACVRLTDGTAYCIVGAFPNLESVCFDSCENITERSVMTLSQGCKNLTKASFRCCNVKLLRKNIIENNSYDITGCPVMFLKASLKKTSDSLRKYKIVVVREQNDDSLIGKSDKNSNNVVDFASIENFNVYECHPKLAHHFASPGTIFVIMSPKPNVIESTIFTSLTKADGSPVIICPKKGSSSVDQIITSINIRFSTCSKLLNNEMNFEEQQLVSNMKKAEYLFKQTYFVPKASLADIKNLKSSLYQTAVTYVDACFPEQTLLNSLNLQDLPAKCTSDKLNIVQSTEIVVKLWCLAVQGEIVVKQLPKTFGFCVTTVLTKCINGLSKFTNKDSDGRLIPWLPEDCNTYYKFQQKTLLEKLNLTEVQIDILKDILSNCTISMTVQQPWVNDWSAQPCAFLPALLPIKPAVILDTIWPQFCSNNEQEMASMFTLTFQPPDSFLNTLFYYCIRFGQIVVLWADGVILHYGCVEVFLQLTNQSSVPPVDLPTLQLGVRTLKIKTVEQKDNDNDSSNSQEENLKSVLITTYQLFRQFIVSSMIQQNLFAIESIKCPKCAKTKKLHEIHFFATSTLTCGKTTFALEELGLDDCYPDNICYHGSLTPCATTPRLRCVMCSEMFENYSDEFWCGKEPGTQKAGDEEESRCFTCTACLKLLGIQNATLNKPNSHDLYMPQNDFEMTGYLYELQICPIVIVFEVKSSSYFDIIIQPLDISGQVFLVVDTNGCNLNQLCPNNDKIILRRSSSDDDDNISCTLNVPSRNINQKFSTDQESIVFRLILVEKPASVMIQSLGCVDPRVFTITTGMPLEANRREDFPDEIGLAHVKGINDKGHLYITFDTPDEKANYWTTVTDVNLHPLCYAYTNNKPLRIKDVNIKSILRNTYDEPNEAADMDEDNESEQVQSNVDTMNTMKNTTNGEYWSLDENHHSKWCEYIDTNYDPPVPYQFFVKDQLLNIGFVNICKSYFEEGMKLEAFDQRNPQLNQNIIATIKEINWEDNTMLVTYDGYENECLNTKKKASKNIDNFGDGGFRYKLDEGYIHPIGYSAFAHKTLIAPPNYENYVTDNGAFLWLSYFYDIGTVVPAPYHYFTEEQIGGCPKHVIYSLMIPEDSRSDNNYCNDSSTMCRFNAYGSQHTYELIRFMNEMSCLSRETFYGFIPLPLELTAAEDFLYPRRNLIHKFEQPEKQRIYTMLIKQRSVIPADTHYETDEYKSVGIVQNSLKLMKELLPPNGPEVKGKGNTMDSLGHFFFSYYFEIIFYLIFVKRYKFIINMDDFKELFPSLKTVDARQLTEGLNRYCSLLLSTLLTVFSSNKTAAYNIEGAELKVMSDDLLQVLSSGVSAETFFNVMPRSVEVRTMESKKTLETYKFPHNFTLASITNDFPFSDVSPLIPMLLQFRCLTVISLQQCQFESFEVDTTFLAFSLNTLLLDGNPLRKVPQCVFEFHELRTLSLNSCGIRDLPDSFDKLTKLSSLDLGSNSITSIPPSLSKLLLLRSLSIEAVALYTSRTTITFEEFVKFGQRKHFPTFKNKTPEQFENIIAEKYGIQSFSKVVIEDINDIQQLNSFIVSECPRFESSASISDPTIGNGFPEELLQLKQLESLDLSYQHIMEIPKEISRLRRLKTLTLSGCLYLKEISEQLASIKFFNFILLTGCNALTNPPPEIVRGGQERIIGFLRRSLAGTMECRRTKLIMVGLGGAGKTKSFNSVFRFVEALKRTDLKAEEEDAPEVTDGINISSITKAVNNETSIEYSIWDFAGQSVYYNTHQFFLSNRAIYILLWNSRLGYENSGLEFWLSSIACHAPKAPVFVVATHADQISHIEIPRSELQATFPKIVYFAHISSITGYGMQDLMDKIVEVTLAQPYINLKVPTIYLNLEGKIAETDDGTNETENMIMDFNKVCDLCKPLGLITTQEVKDALSFLHELGSLQYFTNNVLKDFVILQPQWLVDAMACLISVKTNVVQDGRFTKNDVGIIWSKYPKKLHQWLLQLTEEFDLSFPLKDEDINIVPCMLPDVEPQIDWIEPDNKTTFKTKMVFKFEYLPAGLFNRTQSRLCQYSEGSKIWKKGSLLNKNDHLALLRQTKDKELTVTVQGARPENVLFLIHEVIENLIHDFFQGVSYDLLLPCPDCTKSGTHEPHMFSCKQVKRATDLKAPFLQCAKLFHIISLHTLHTMMPPSSMADYEQHMLKMVQDMNDLQSSVATDVCILCCASDVNQPNQTCPTSLCKNLEKNKFSSTIIILKEDDDTLDEFGLKISKANLVIICISTDFCASKKCSDLYAYIRQSHKTLFFAIVGKNSDWKSSSIGLQIMNDLFFDFQKTERFDSKFDELLTRIKARCMKKAKESRRPVVFFSYCWANSAECAKLGHRKIDSALGEVDPRELGKDIANQDIDIWIDYKNVGQGALFEDIADAIRHAYLFVACVSDEYLASQNCLREFRFASTVQLTKVICVVGKGDNWQKSELNFLAFDASIYNFQTRSKDTFSNLVRKIKLILSQKMPKDVPPRPTGGAVDSNKSKKTSVAQNNFSAYKELGELAQRKLLHQANIVATKLRATDVTMGKPYPRMFFLDLRTPESKDDKTKSENSESKGASGRPGTSGRVKTAGGNALWNNLELGDLCFKWLCENEGGWHVTGDPVAIASVDEYFVGTFTEFLDRIAPFQSQILNLLQHTAVVVEMLQHKSGHDYLNDLKLRANSIGPEGFESSYRFMYRLIRQLDSKGDRGEMQRCYLYSKKIVWLCPDHLKFSRSTLADDDVDPDDIPIQMDETDANTYQPNADNSYFLDRNTYVPPIRQIEVNNAEIAVEKVETPQTSADTNEDATNRHPRTKSKACSVM